MNSGPVVEASSNGPRTAPVTALAGPAINGGDLDRFRQQLSNPGLENEAAVFFALNHGESAALANFLSQHPEDRADIVQNLAKILDADSSHWMSNATNPKEVLSAVVHDLTTHGTITQDNGRTATCTVTVFQENLRRTDPAEYTRLIAGLMTDGKVQLRGGAYANLNAEAIEVRGFSTSVVVQSALMGMCGSYDPATDQVASSHGVHRGLYAEQYGYVALQLTGQSIHVHAIKGVEDARAVLDAIREREGGISGIAVDMDWASSGDHVRHMVMVEKIEDGMVTLWNGQYGKRVEMTEADFLMRLNCVMEVGNGSGLTVEQGETVVLTPQDSLPDINHKLSELGINNEQAFGIFDEVMRANSNRSGNHVGPEKMRLIFVMTELPQALSSRPDPREAKPMEVDGRPAPEPNNRLRRFGLDGELN